MLASKNYIGDFNKLGVAFKRQYNYLTTEELEKLLNQIKSDKNNNLVSSSDIEKDTNLSINNHINTKNNYENPSSDINNSDNITNNKSTSIKSINNNNVNSVLSNNNIINNNNFDYTDQNNNNILIRQSNINKGYNESKIFNNNNMNSALENFYKERSLKKRKKAQDFINSNNEDYYTSNLIKNLSTGQNFNDKEKKLYFESLPEKLKTKLTNYNLNHSSFVFIKDYIKGMKYSGNINLNRRYYIFVKFGKFNHDEDAEFIPYYFHKFHLVKFYTMIYNFSHNNHEFYFTYFFFYYSVAVKLNIRKSKHWFFLDSFPKQLNYNLLAGVYGNKNLIFLNFVYTTIYSDDNTRKIDFDLITNIRQINCLEYINLFDLYKRKTYYLKKNESVNIKDNTYAVDNEVKSENAL